MENSMEITPFTVGLFAANCFLIRDPATGAAAIVDTGEGPDLRRRLERLDPRPDVQAILLTHAHVDHAGALADLQQGFDAPTWMAEAERPVFESLPSQGNWFGARMLNRPCGRVDHWLGDGAEVPVGDLRFRLLLTPGHTPGQACFVGGGHAFVGDLLFAGSIGRTDFPGGDMAAMKKSLLRLFQLPLETRVHCGHGESTTLQAELLSNPFLGFVRRALGIEDTTRWSMDW
jgi:glyoxylase-like metal-dependent hydrolase (beta-lactamase superfamily II)